MDFLSMFGLILIICFSILFCFEQLKIWKIRRFMNGPLFVIPFFGSVFKMVLNPYEFYEEQKKYGDISWNLIAGKIFVYTKNPEFTKKIFKNEGGKLRLWLHLNATKILGNNNIAFMNGNSHKSLRKELLGLFSTNSLSKYLTIQEKEIEKHIEFWKKSDIMTKPKEIRILVRDLNVDTYLLTFLLEII